MVDRKDERQPQSRVPEGALGVGFPQHKVEEVAPKVYCITAFGNVGFVVTDEGVVVVDTALRQMEETIREGVREVTDAPIHSVIYTHGHYDHAFGVSALLREAERSQAQNNWPRKCGSTLQPLPGIAGPTGIQ